MFFRFVTKHACDGRTDGQNYNSANIAASRGKTRGRALTPRCHLTAITAYTGSSPTRRYIIPAQLQQHNSRDPLTVLKQSRYRQKHQRPKWWPFKSPEAVLFVIDPSAVIFICSDVAKLGGVPTVLTIALQRSTSGHSYEMIKISGQFLISGQF